MHSYELRKRITLHTQLLCIRHASNPPFSSSPDTHRTVRHSHTPKGPTSWVVKICVNCTHKRYEPGLETSEGRVFCKYLLVSYYVTGIENRNMAKSECYPHGTYIKKKRPRI